MAREHLLVVGCCLVATFGEVNIGICRRFPIKIQYILLGHNRSYLFVNVDVVDVNRKKRSTAIMPFIVNREYPEKKSTVLQIIFNCLKCYNVTQASLFLYNFSVVSDVNLLLLTSCKKLDSVFQVCLLRNFFL